ncbi:MAG: hypothetical protein LBM23_01400 [Propionibacteriaceae bacterium]|jgi:hypothetical protein|nr:hypothetical protein [Propionibacteriaceae bacterium]
MSEFADAVAWVLAYGVACVVIFIVTVPLHEGGHFLAGKLAGHRLIVIDALGSH